MRSISWRWEVGRLCFSDDYLKAGLAQVIDVLQVRFRVGHQRMDVADWPDISKRLLAELAVIGKGYASLCRLNDHFLDLRFCMIGSRDPICGIDSAHAQDRFVQPDLGKGTLGPLSGEIDGVFLQIATGAQDGDTSAVLQLAYDGRGIGHYSKPVAVVQAACQ